MEVILAKTAGFCFGVQRAVDKVYELLDAGVSPLYTLGPIIHNEQVVEDLEKRGVRTVQSAEELSSLPKGRVVIRSHGVGREIYRRLEELGFPYEDVTCPFVKKIHRIVEREAASGHQVVIIGDPAHPEVQGICGWCGPDKIVMETREEAAAFSADSTKTLTVVSQTTFNYNKFQDLVEILGKKSYDINVLNTICNATEDRQREARDIAARVDTMLVIGGRHSSNTQKLYQICKRECENTYYIQTLIDLDSEMFRFSSCVGITAGASTPKKIIEEVQKHVRIKF